jgi:hypothetical protein
VIEIGYLAIETGYLAVNETGYLATETGYLAVIETGYSAIETGYLAVIETVYHLAVETGLKLLLRYGGGLGDTPRDCESRLCSPRGGWSSGGPVPCLGAPPTQ